MTRIPSNNRMKKLKRLYFVLAAWLPVVAYPIGAAGDTAWGESVEGVSVRLCADKTNWTTNETPTFKVDVRNQGQREFYAVQSQETGRLEVDGVWYGWTGGFDLKGSGLPPGREYHDIPVSLESNWKATQDWHDKTQAASPQIPLKLLPGKHTIRFAPEIRDINGKPKPQNNYVPSNPVEIEIWSNLKELAEPAIAKSTPTNSFGIYLTTESVDPRITAYGKGDWSNVRLAEFPVISAADILAYDFTNHLMTLKPEALKRIPRPNASGTPFVVVANGERVYLGIFMTLNSSMSRAIPSIVIDEHVWDTNLPPNTLRISRVYAAPYSKDDPDPRSDDRIRRTLSALQYQQIRVGMSRDEVYQLLGKSQGSIIEGSVDAVTEIWIAPPDSRGQKIRLAVMFLADGRAHQVEQDILK